MTVEEDADIDDGHLNLYSLEFDHLWVLALVYPAFRKGRHGKWEKVRTLVGRDFKIRTLRPRPINTDGEISTDTPAHFRILPGAVSVLAPIKAAGTT
jgi:diacylglycerol kinase (ATP)